MTNLATPAFEDALDHLRSAPRREGTVELVVCRPRAGTREVLEVGVLDTKIGLVGDSWARRRSRSTPDGRPHPEKQITLMGARIVDLVAGSRERWPLAGDQLYVDFDLSIEHLPPGTRVRVGTAVVEITEPPHTGCPKFVKQFGKEAMRFVNSPEGRLLRLRGANAKVVEGGEVRAGDVIRIEPA